MIALLSSPARLTHHALVQLLRYQAIAKLRRLGRGFATRRRLVLSSLAVLLALVWLGQFAVSILLREPSDLLRVRGLISLGLMAYGLWHVLRAAHKRPEQAIEWTAAEREVLYGAPFRHGELLAYRLGGIFTSAVFKAACFGVVMLPDLRLPWMGAIGLFAALLFLDLFRMIVEIAAWGATPRGYRWFRIPVLLGAAVAGVCTLLIALSTPGRPANSIALALRLAESAAQLRDTWLGIVLEAPYHVFANVITAQQLSWQLAGWTALAALMVGTAAAVLARVNDHVARATVQREQRQYTGMRRVGTAGTAHQADIDEVNRGRWWAVPTLRQAGQVPGLPRVPQRLGLALAWRQSVGVRRYAASVLLALAAPAMLCASPLVVWSEPWIVLINVVGALAFYSFLLLPAALKFDFRRDIERMVLLKSLPLRPRTVVAGQLATPVVIACVLQAAVLLLTGIARPVPVPLLLGIFLLMIPLTIGIFALENLIFLLYPHRLQEEGIHIFLRTTLTFTAKGVLFGLCAVLLVGWAMLSQHLARALGLASGTVTFILGLGVIVAVCAAVTTRLLVWAYDRFDPSQDIPG